MQRTVFAVLIVAVSMITAGPPPVAAKEPPLPEGRDHSFTKEEEEKALTIQRQYQDAGKELAETHAEALRRPELQAPLESLRKAMETEMIREAPDKKQQILRRYEVHRQMRALEKIEQPTKEDKDHYQALLLEFTNLSEALDDLPKQAANSAALQPERKKFEKALLAVMTSINPKTPELMQQQKKSVADYNTFTQELLKKELAPKPLAPAAESAETTNAK